MKNAIILTISILLSSIVSAQTTLPINEGFESTFPPSGWSQAYVSSTRDWKANEGGYKPPSITYGSPAFAYNGTYNAFFQTNTVGHTTKLITPTIDMTSVQKPIIEFYEARVSRIQADELRVFYRLSPQDDWHMVAEFLDESDDWTFRQIILPFKTETPEDDTLRTNTFQIAFEGKSNSGYGVCVDDVYIYESAKLDLEVENISAKAINSTIASGTSLNPIGYIYVSVKGNDGTLALNSTSIAYSSNSIDDISNIRLYATNDSTFRKNQEIIVTPTKEGNTFTFTGLNHNLTSGDNYIWITVDTDISTNHNSELMFSVPVNSISIGDFTYPSIALNPSGKSIIEKSIVTYDFESTDGWELDLDGIWQIGSNTGVGNNDPLGPYDGNSALATNLNGNYPNSVSEHIHSTSENINAKYFKDINIHYKRWLNNNYQHNMLFSISSDNKQTWITKFTNNNAAVLDNNWVNIRLDAQISRVENLSARFTIGSTTTSLAYGGWNIDNFAITGEFIHSDVGISDMITPTQACGLTNAEDVKVTLRNYGGATVDVPFDLGYSLNGGASYTRETYSTPIESEADPEGVYEVEYTFSTKADFSTPGFKSLKFRTFLDGDQDSSNDLYETTFFVFPTVTFPYQTSFESNNAYWYPSGTNTSWEWGAPTGTAINQASDGSRVWGTYLSKKYNQDEISYLESPCFDMTGAEMPVISFDYMMQTEEGIDGLAIEYSINGGETWNILPADDNYAFNWFDSPEVESLGTAGWSVNKTEYVTAKSLLPTDVDELSGVKFRFVFGSNSTTQYEGVALDMIRVYELPYDLGITELVSPTTACEIGKNQTLELKLKNYGYRTVPVDAVIPIAIQVNDGEIKTENITISSEILQNGEYTFTTTNTFDLFSAGTYEITAYTNLDVDDNNANNSHTTSVDVLGMPEFTLGPDIGVEDFSTAVTLDAGAGYTSYSWYKDPDYVTSLGANQTFDVSEESTIRVIITKEITDGPTCEAQDDISIIIAEKDLGISSILNLEDACEQSAPLNPQVEIESFRTFLFDGEEAIPLVLEVDGEIILTEDFTPELNWGTQGETATFTFSGTIDLSEAKTYNISIYTNIQDDLNRTNDNKSIEISTFGNPSVSIMARTNVAPERYTEFNEITTTSADTLYIKATEGFSDYIWERQSYGQSNWTTTGTNSNIYEPSLNNSITYRVTATDPNGCGNAQATLFVNAFDLSITAINSPLEEFCDKEEETPLVIVLKNTGKDAYQAGTVIQLSATSSTSSQNTELTLTNPLNADSEIVYEFPEKTVFPVGETFISFTAQTTLDPNTNNNERSITTNAKPSPWVTIEPDVLYKIFEPSESYRITPSYSPDVTSYLWQDNSSTETYFIYETPQYITYEVTASNDIGCTASDNIVIITNDLTVTEIIAPRTSCELRDNSPVTFTLRNSGNTTYAAGTNIDVDLYLDGTLVGTETITLAQNLASKSSEQFTLTQTLDLSTLSSATVQVDISSSAEEVDYDNNSRNKSVYALGFPQPDLGAGGDIYAWEKNLDPGYFDQYLWQDKSTERIFNATESGTYSVTVTDFSGCQGTDEITLTFYKDDIELLEVLEPATGCGLTNQENITYRVQNNGNYPIPIGRVIDVGYTLDGVDYPETFTTTEEIAVGSTFDITLPNTIDLSQPDEYTVLFWVDMQNDGFENNSITQTINSYPEVNLSLNYADGTVSNVPLVLDAGEGYSAYQWTYNSTNVSAEQTYTANQSGTFGVLVTDGNGCQGYQEIDVTILMPDYSIAEIISPVSSCVLGTSNQVEVRVANMGTDRLTAGEELEIELWHNQTLVATESFTMESNLEPSQTLDITLAHTLDLSTASEHTIAAKVIAPIDRNSANDSLAVDIFAWGNPVVDLGDNRVIKNGSLVLDAGAGYESYLWQDDSENQTFTVTETGNYSVTVTDANGCQGSDEVRVDVLIPDYSVSAILSPTSGCERTSSETITLEIANTGTDTLLVGNVLPITVYANTVEVASEEYVLTQRVEPEQKVNVTLATKANLSETISYEFVATVNHPLDNNAANNSFTTTVEHYPNPEVDLGDDLITYDPVVLDAGAGYESYLWQDVSTEQTYTVTETGLYHVLVTSEHGCQTYDEINITLLVADYAVSNMFTPTSSCDLTSSESISIEISNLGTDTLKVGDTMPISIEVESQDAINETLTIDQWLEPGEKASFTLNTTLDLSAESENSISISANHPLDKITNNNTLALSVEHYPTPIVDLGEDFEAYDPVTLDAGAGYETYLWQDGSDDQTLTATETGTYSVTVTNQYGCEGYDEISIIFDYSSRIYVANITSPSSQACNEDELTVEITIENQRNQTIDAGTELTASYRVNEETVSETITLEQALEHNQTVSHTFTEKFEAEEGTHKLSAWIDYNERPGNKTELNLTVHPTPNLDLGDDLEVTFPYTIESGISNVDYLWSTTETSPSITVDNPGEYWLTVTNQFGCEASDTINLTISSVQVMPGTNTIVTVFPNPADQWITVNIEPKQPALFAIELVSPSGQKVYSHTMEQDQSFTHRIDVTHYAPGVYILRVSSGGEWITVKLVINR